MNLLNEAFNSLLKNRKGRAAGAAVAVTFCLLALGAVAQLARNVSAFASDVERSVQVVAYTADKLPEEALSKLQQLIKEEKGVAGCTYVTKEEALKEVINEPDIKNYLESVKENPLPNSIRIEMKPDFKRTADLKAVAEKVSGFPGVTDISFKQQETEKLLMLTGSVRKLSGAALPVCLGLIAAAFSGLWLMFSAGGHEAHTKVHSGKLALVESVLLGGASGLLAALLLCLLEAVVLSDLNNLWSGRWQSAGWIISLALPVFGALLGLSAGFANKAGAKDK